MIICPRCGGTCQDSDKFCQSCGTPMPQQAAENQNQNPNSAPNKMPNWNPNPYQNPYPGMNPYQQPYVQKQSNGYGIAALVLGLVGIGTGFIGAVIAGLTGSVGLGFLFLIPSLLGILFGILGIVRCKKNPVYKGLGLSIAGLVLGIIFFLIFLITCNIMANQFYYSYGLYNDIYDLYDLLY